MEKQSLDVWCLEAHRLAKAKGFWDSYYGRRFSGKLESLTIPIALMHSEVSELLEAVRRNSSAPCDKPLPLTCEEEEAADIFLRLADYCEARKINLGRAASLKHSFNKNRDWKHGKAF